MPLPSPDKLDHTHLPAIATYLEDNPRLNLDEFFNQFEMKNKQDLQERENLLEKIQTLTTANTEAQRNISYLINLGDLQKQFSEAKKQAEAANAEIPKPPETPPIPEVQKPETDAAKPKATSIEINSDKLKQVDESYAKFKKEFYKDDDSIKSEIIGDEKIYHFKTPEEAKAFIAANPGCGLRLLEGDDLKNMREAAQKSSPAPSELVVNPAQQTPTADSTTPPASGPATVTPAASVPPPPGPAPVTPVDSVPPIPATAQPVIDASTPPPPGPATVTPAASVPSESQRMTLDEGAALINKLNAAKPQATSEPVVERPEPEGDRRKSPLSAGRQAAIEAEAAASPVEPTTQKAASLSAPNEKKQAWDSLVRLTSEGDTFVVKNGMDPNAPSVSANSPQTQVSPTQSKADSVQPPTPSAVTPAGEDKKTFHAPKDLPPVRVPNKLQVPKTLDRRYADQHKQLHASPLAAMKNGASVENAVQIAENASKIANAAAKQFATHLDSSPQNTGKDDVKTNWAKLQEISTQHSGEKGNSADADKGNKSEASSTPTYSPHH